MVFGSWTMPSSQLYFQVRNSIYFIKTLLEPMMTLQSTCPMELTRFPYDVQSCTMVFGSWTMPSSQLYFQVRNSICLLYLRFLFHQNFIGSYDDFVCNLPYGIDKVPLRCAKLYYGLWFLDHAFFSIIFSSKEFHLFALSLIFILSEKKNYRPIYDDIDRIFQ